MQKVLVYHNNRLIKTYEFDQTALTIGRLPTNDVSISSMAISRNHLRLEYKSEINAFVALDQQSLNGTYLNGIKLENDSPVPSGSHLIIGQYAINFDYTSDSSSSTQTFVIPSSETPLQAPPQTQQQPIVQESTSTPSSVTAQSQRDEYSSASEGTSTGYTSSSTTSTSIGSDTAGFYFGTKGSHDGAGKVTSRSSAYLIEQSTKMEHSINKKEINFGNALNDDIFVDEGKIAKITVTGSNYEIKALKVMGKIIVNGEKVGQHILKDGDVFKVGKSTFIFKKA